MMVRSAQSILAALTIIVLVYSAEPIHAKPSPATAPPTFASANVSREKTYRVDARVRALLFWIRKTNVGDGRIAWRTGPEGVRGYELLVGTSPARTPRGINRWGYIREESGPQGAIVFGVMSSSEEQSIEEADRNTSRAGSVHRFKALQQRATGAEAHVIVSNVESAADLTYNDLQALMDAVPGAQFKSRTSPLAAWTSPGFLAATAELIEDGRLVATRSWKAPLPSRVYPYNGQLYELYLRSAQSVSSFTHDKQSFGPAIRGEFRVVNTKTREETDFTVVYGTDGEVSGVPLFISFRPRWWLEVNCVLSDQPPDPRTK